MMKTIFFFIAVFAALCNAQFPTFPPGCIGNCIGGDCPAEYSCNSATQLCCLSTTSSSTSSSSGACVDKIGPKGFSDCPQRVFLCNSTLYYTLMTDQCPKTCGRCNGAGSTVAISTTSSPSSINCVDKIKADGTSDCPGLTRLCNSPQYFNLMTEQCPKTCGRCGASTIASSTISIGKK